MKRIALTALLVVAATARAGVSPQGPPEQALVCVAELTGRNVAPGPVETAAASRATAVLVGNRFTVHGSFVGLSSPLRDIAKTPDDPGVHLHPLDPSKAARVLATLDSPLGAPGGDRASLGACH